MSFEAFLDAIPLGTPLRRRSRICLDPLDMSEHLICESEHGLGRVFVPSGPWKPEYSAFLRREGIDGLRLSASVGWKGTDLQFLSELPFLRSLEVYAWDVRDCSVIGSLRELRHLGLECDLRGSIDFAQLAKLEVVLVTWAKALDGVLRCQQVRHLNVSNWPEVDLLRLEPLTKLRELFVASRKLHSLRGISTFSLLDKLELHGCPKLATLDGIQSCGRLTSLEMSACKAVGDVSVLAHLGSLRKVELNSCGDIRSLAPLAALRGLERLSFDGDTRILDCDLSFMERIPRLRELVFAPRRAYNRTRQQLLGKGNA